MSIAPDKIQDELDNVLRSIAFAPTANMIELWALDAFKYLSLEAAMIVYKQGFQEIKRYLIADETQAYPKQLKTEIATFELARKEKRKHFDKQRFILTASDTLNISAHHLWEIAENCEVVDPNYIFLKIKETL